jgi:hypothetical protein
MSKPALRFTAIVLCGLIVLVLFAGLDDLPRSVRAEIASERQALSTGRQQFDRARKTVEQALAAEPDLFRARSMNTAFPQRLHQATGKLDSATKELAALAELEKKNRRQDREQAEQLLARQRSLRTAALSEAAAVRTEADRWIGLKRNLPATLAQMERDHQAITSTGVASLAGTVQRAATDWPAKKGDLENRLGAVNAAIASAGALWQSTAEPRRLAAARELPGPEFPALLDAADTLHTSAAALPQKTAEISALTSQLYVSWDKILEDLDPEGGGCRQKLKVVRTRLLDVSGAKSETSSQDEWVTEPRRTCDVQRDNLGMAIQHKSAGQYDYEAQSVAQPAGFAYMASPAQGSNQYGRWERRDGGSFWVWYGQYALMRDLFFRRDYRPLDTREYNDYRQMQSRGRTYYGRDDRIGAPKYGTGGSVTQRRFPDSVLGRSRGYSESRYARGGGYGSSRYSSRPGVFGPRRPSSSHTFGRSAGRIFGGGRRFGRR